MVERVITVRLIGDARGFVAAFAQAGTASVAMGNKVASGSNKAINAMRSVGKVAATVGKITILGLAAGLALSAKAAIDFESSFAGVRKTVDTSEAGFARLELSLRGLSKIIPVNVNELNRIGELGGQLGVGATAIPQFTKTIAELGVTTNLATDQAALGLARLDNILGLNQKSFGRLGSTIVDLGNNFASTESEILNFALRIAPVGGIVGLAAGEVLAIGTAFSSVGVKAERGGTAVQKTLIAISEAAQDGGDDLDRFAEIAGLSADAYQELVNTNSSKAFVAFINGLERITLEGGNVFKALRDVGLGGVRTTQSLLAVAAAGELIEDTLARQDIAWRDNVALTEEAAKRFDTTASKIKLAVNRLRDLAITIGQAVLPQIGALAQGVADFGDGLALLPGFITNVIKVLLGLASAAAVGKVALGLLAKVTGTSLVASLGLGALAAGGLAAVIGVVLVGAIGFAVKKIADFGAAQRETRARVLELVEAMDLEEEGFEDNGKAALKARIIRDGLISSLNKIGLGADTFADAIFGDEDSINRVNVALEKGQRLVDEALENVPPLGSVNFEERSAIFQTLRNELDIVRDLFAESSSDLVVAKQTRLDNAIALAENRAIERGRKQLRPFGADLIDAANSTDEFDEALRKLGSSAQISFDDVNLIRDAVIDYGGAMAESFGESEQLILGQINAWEELGETVVINVGQLLGNLNQQVGIIDDFETLIRDLNISVRAEGLIRSTFGGSLEDQLSLVKFKTDDPLGFRTLIIGLENVGAEVLSTARKIFLEDLPAIIQKSGPELFSAMKEVVKSLVEDEDEDINPAEAWLLVIEETLKLSPPALQEAIKTAIRDGLLSVTFDLSSVGANALDTLINGILSKKAELERVMRGITEGVIRVTRQGFLITSPSKIFMDIGKNVVDGFRIGLQDTANTLQGFGLNSLGIPNRHQLIGGSTTNTTNSVANNFNLNVSGSNNVADDARSVLMTAQIIGAT